MARKLKVVDMREGSNSGTIDAEELAKYVKEAATVMRQQKHWANVLKDICARGHAAGVARKEEIRRLASESIMDQEDQEALILKRDRMDELRAALGPLFGTPLGDAAA